MTNMKKINIKACLLVPYEENNFKGLTLIELEELSQRITKHQIIPKKDEIIDYQDRSNLHITDDEGSKIKIDTSGKFKVVKVEYSFFENIKDDYVIVALVDTRLKTIEPKDVQKWKETN